MYTLVFSKRYSKEVLEAELYYEGEQQRLGAHFLAAVSSALDRLETHPAAFAAVHDTPLRKIQLRRFPYAIYYRIVGRCVRVSRCYCTHRKPLYLRQHRS